MGNGGQRALSGTGCQDRVLGSVEMGEAGVLGRVQ